MKKLLILGAASLALAACSSGGDADKDGDGTVSAGEAKDAMAGAELKAGEYEVKMTFSEFDAPGMPAAAIDAMKGQMNTSTKQCITEEQAKNMGAEMFGGAEESGCKMDKMDRSGNNMTATMSCDVGGMNMDSNINGTIEAESYTMNIDQTIKGGPTGDMTMKGKVEAKRIGDCPA